MKMEEQINSIKQPNTRTLLIFHAKIDLLKIGG